MGLRAWDYGTGVTGLRSLNVYENPPALSCEELTPVPFGTRNPDREQTVAGFIRGSVLMIHRGGGGELAHLEEWSGEGLFGYYGH